ncbi:hypothetical protein BJ973_004715 [Actinoplanes tereljensis]|uniref:hypothetical protein n=1 Tax=Paractinoplanes tereljensis TaxID=571912 RepID=UPI003391A820
MTPSETLTATSTLRRHHSTGTNAAANTGTCHHEWVSVAWAIAPAATSRAVSASDETTFITASSAPSAVRTPASSQSRPLTPAMVGSLTRSPVASC